MSSPLEILTSTFGYPKFRGEQEAIIQNTLSGNHSLVLMPTGMGKSACYQISARLLRGTTLILSPLIALMKDQVDEAKKRGFKCAFINSSLSPSERLKRYQKLADGAYEFIYVTPERFQKQEFLEAVGKVSVPLLAIDEAHCISQWGHDFRPDYTRILEFREQLKNPTLMALTATATQEVQKDIVSQMGLEKEEIKIFSHGVERSNLTLETRQLSSMESKVEDFRKIVEQERGPIVVYFSLISSLEKFSLLIENSIPHLIYHGQMEAKSRRRNQNTFMESRDAIILATPAFGLGVNKADIRLVVHGELPGSLEAYYQEVGRAGRDGLPAKGILLYDEDDLTIQMDFIKWANPEPDFIRSVYRLLEANPDRVNAEGTDYLRGQLHFYHRRDFRLETSLNLLERWGCLEGSLQNRDLKVVQPPPKEFLDNEWHLTRLKRQRQKLLQMVQFAKQESDYFETIRAYFS